jgi:hypothetical protein
MRPSSLGLAPMSCERFYRALGKPRDHEFSVTSGPLFSLRGHVVPIGGEAKPFEGDDRFFSRPTARFGGFAISL